MLKTTVAIQLKEFGSQNSGMESKKRLNWNMGKSTKLTLPVDLRCSFWRTG